jgi:hypothetical protein
MPTRMLLLLDDSIPLERIDECRTLATSFAAYTSESVFFAALDGSDLADIRAWARDKAGDKVDRIDPETLVTNAPMSAAPFVFNDDGTPDWSTMWQTFCELALYGGPPHRGDDEAIEAAVTVDAPAQPDFDAVAEIRRGIWETTGLFSEPDEPGWLAISCSSRKMAAWMCAAIVLENVDARMDEDRLLVPASRDYELQNQVKSVITVVAKTHHYWTAHAQAQETAARQQSEAAASGL